LNCLGGAEASMLRPAATDISGFGGGRGPERAGL